MRYDLTAGFPLITTKKVHTEKSVIYELLWFLRGDSNVQWCRNTASASGTNGLRRQAMLGPVTGVQLAVRGPTPSGEHIDQISNALERC